MPVTPHNYELQIKYRETCLKLDQMEKVRKKQDEVSAELTGKIASQKDVLEYLNRMLEQREREVETLLSVLAEKERRLERLSLIICQLTS